MPKSPHASLLALLLTACAAPGAPSCGPHEARAVNDLMYFGTAKPGGSVTPQEWSEFLRGSVTPRFPKGLTVWPASGQWQGADGTLTEEHSFVLSLLHSGDARDETAVRSVADEYKARFSQEAVLRVRSQVCTSF